MAETQKSRLAYLHAMGIQVWSLRLQPACSETSDVTGAALLTEDEALSPARDGCASVQSGRGQGPLLQPGAWVASNANPIPAEIEISSPACGWDDLHARVANCTACPLHLTRTQTVFGVGNRNSDWMVIGEAPGEQEDLQGEPFVGRAGLLLNEMLRAIGLERDKVFIANILKCRPPKNRDPEPGEAAACEGYLQQQVAMVKPRIILAVGRIAAQNLLKTTTPIGKLRSIIHDYQGVPLVVTYHPAYLLRSPLEKRKAFDDLRLALKTYRQTR